MRHLIVSLIAFTTACNAPAPGRGLGSAPMTSDASDPCTTACQYRKDHCHMLPSVDDCVTSCHIGDAGLPSTICGGPRP